MSSPYQPEQEEDHDRNENEINDGENIHPFKKETQLSKKVFHRCRPALSVSFLLVALQILQKFLIPFEIRRVEIDDEVLVSFENGDINNPFIVGTLWNKKDKPPKGKILDPASKKVNERVIRSRTGHLIILDDTQGAEKILIQDQSKKNSITIDSKTNAMTFKTAGDFTIDAGGKFIVNSKLDMMLDSKGKSGFKSKTGMEIDCPANAKVKTGANMLELTAAGAALKGAKLDLQGTATASLKGSAMVEINGGIVKIN